ncbi:hypothetical protein M407DRAFT_67796 [Tulasnella calospora MUT 4182]|uniref:RZ-type domain-containing protein n=1 Tax=Tulasnella calospora MUT 4182 TaxID=1051891 RepID=A0A0C3QTG6_9AGAM|nr:hypothetical protein M407DRAFT_67796 [Tulasnella calospora MUT 4182]
MGSVSLARFPSQFLLLIPSYLSATRGHFYRCRNGHPYVIGECGGAMERSRCPECGETIGGGGHTLDSSNSRAADFENLAGGLGVAANPWPWGQGA